MAQGSIEYGTSFFSQIPRVIFNTAGEIQHAVKASLAEDILQWQARPDQPLRTWSTVRDVLESITMFVL